MKTQMKNYGCAVYDGETQVGTSFIDDSGTALPSDADIQRAKLFAASRDLLEACKVGLAGMIAWGGKCEANGEMILAKAAVEKADLIRAAIAKADPQSGNDALSKKQFNQ